MDTEILISSNFIFNEILFLFCLFSLNRLKTVGNNLSLLTIGKHRGQEFASPRDRMSVLSAARV